MSTESISVLVAGLAVVVGAIFQYATIRSTRRNTISQLRADVVEARVAALRETLAEYITVSFWVEHFNPRSVMEQSVSMKEYNDRVEREDRLYNRLRLYLVPGDPNHERLLGRPDDLRDPNATDEWKNRRERLEATANRYGKAATTSAALSRSTVVKEPSGPYVGVQSGSWLR